MSFLRPRPRRRAAGLAERLRVLVAGSSFGGKAMFFLGKIQLGQLNQEQDCKV